MNYDFFCSILGVNEDSKDSESLFTDCVHKSVDCYEKYEIQCFLCKSFVYIYAKYRKLVHDPIDISSFLEQSSLSDDKIWMDSLKGCPIAFNILEKTNNIQSLKKDCNSFKKIFFPWKPYFSSNHWKNIVSRRREIDSNRCRICGTAGSYNNPMNVHHLTYARFGCEDINDLICLCKECHQKLHNKRKEEKTVTEEMKAERMEKILRMMVCLDNNKQIIASI